MSFLKNYQFCTQNNEVPPIYHLFSGLAALSSLVSGKVWLDRGLFFIRPNLYVVLTGEPGVKKSTAMDIAKQLLREVGAAACPMTAECQTKEDLTQMLATKTKLCQVKPGEVPKRFSPLDEECSKYLYAPITACLNELSQFVGTSTAAHMLDFLTCIFSEHEYTNSTKKSGVDKIPMPYFCLLSCTVPAWITSKLKDDVISGGFSRRAFFVYATHSEQRIAFPDVSDEMKAAWEVLVEQAKKIATLKGPYHWGVGAKEFFQAWYESLVRPDDPVLIGWFNSVDTQMLKVAMLVAASEWDGESIPTIEISYMEMSIELIKLVEVNLPKVYKGVGRNELYGISNKIIELLERAPENQLPERFVKKELFREANIDEISKIILHLLAIRSITRVSGPLPPGAPTEVFLKLITK